ncbi:DUF6090 family protein [Draconibacterium sp. IB214405]|uniref:DUF6090 family protein n=1 Tax=Draconibacterium sp. IB214405 TaxID=3097352 RepID=UPI002A13E978|nr:DUF6090 family protein [Draconibacterium sp. IB214405]MDX8337884.1 DUF6090 family protein [Draconibacterium sp. IB214405]
MLRFFSKMRYKLAAENKLGRYMRYAIGEILLVMIGILMALQVNNWNEQRKIQNDIEETKKSLEQELENNIFSTNYLLNVGYELSDVLNEIETHKTLRDLKYGFGSFYGKFGIFDTYVQELETENLNDFIALEKRLLPDDKSALFFAKMLKEDIVQRQVWETKATELSLQRFKEFSDELPWFYDTDSIANAKREDYIQNNQIFRNKVIHYLNFQLNENFYGASTIRNLSLVLLWNLQHKGKSNADFGTFLTGRGLVPFKRFDCDSANLVEPDFIGFRNIFIVYNPSSKEVVLHKINRENNENLLTRIKPGFRRIISMDDEDYIQVGDDCEKVYYPVRNGFLLLDKQED